MSAGLPRVLLVDDDAAIRRFVGMVLEDEPLQLICCEDGESALREIRTAPVALLISDLMMPGLNGFELFEQLLEAPELRAGAALMAFSAGLSPERVERLARLGVTRLLDKPASVRALLDAVRDALALRQGEAPVPTTGRCAAPVPDSFGGDAQLYAAFLATCRERYPEDLGAAERALAQQDLAGLLRAAHNLKGSLSTLGEARLASLAMALERACAREAAAGELALLCGDLLSAVRAWLAADAKDSTGCIDSN